MTQKANVLRKSHIFESLLSNFTGRPKVTFEPLLGLLELFGVWGGSRRRRGSQFSQSFSRPQRRFCLCMLVPTHRITPGLSGLLSPPAGDGKPLSKHTNSEIDPGRTPNCLGESPSLFEFIFLSLPAAKHGSGGSKSSERDLLLHSTKVRGFEKGWRTEGVGARRSFLCQRFRPLFCTVFPMPL